MSQFFNAVYALSADASDPTAVYIYDAAGKSWSKQSTGTPSGSPAFDPTSYKAILDHDTNVFYALSGGELFFLDFSTITTSANGSTSGLAWTDVGKPSFDTTNYQPVMALAQNHIHFLDVPGLSPGQADIFVIHFSFFQPDAQAYPTNGSGAAFPQTHGQAVSLFQPAGAGVQQEFVFIPDDASATYVINVESNTTAVLPGPGTKDAGAQYFAGVTSIVQLASDGRLSFLSYTQDDASANANAAWAAVSAVSVPASVSSAGTSAKASQTPGAAQGSGTGSSSGAKPTGSNASAAIATRAADVLLTMMIGAGLSLLLL